MIFRFPVAPPDIPLPPAPSWMALKSECHALGVACPIPTLPEESMTTSSLLAAVPNDIALVLWSYRIRPALLSDPELPSAKKMLPVLPDELPVKIVNPVEPEPVPITSVSARSSNSPALLRPIPTLPSSSIRILSVTEAAPSAVVENTKIPGMSFEPGLEPVRA